MTRRRYPWSEVAAMARKADGAWRLHSSLVAVDLNLLHHARRRVKALRPDEHGHFEFARRNVGLDEFDRRVFDLFIRYTKEGI